MDPTRFHTIILPLHNNNIIYYAYKISISAISTDYCLQLLQVTICYYYMYSCNGVSTSLNQFFEVGVSFKTVHVTGHHIMAEGIVGLGEEKVDVYNCETGQTCKTGVTYSIWD